ncbi:histidine kinase [Curvivirga aplysinae]|uniref:histidine kinase n=1 Tax=Curvivirga aplysinae TaxID=2529852 RepID=UPI0012BD23EE|nr:histidine kinase [Curvivirga aplysinae]MTI09029.1 histidine kinase [Curvivirga aplysinae]
MTHFLQSDEKPDGYKLEDILHTIRKDVITRCQKITDDHRSEAQHVLNNNIEILKHISDAIKLAEDSTQVLNRSFGPSRSGKPRIGEE